VGVTVCPPLFGWLVQWWGAFGEPWAVLALVMGVALLLLLPVREGRVAMP
jgi:hypothetical protein